MTPDTRHRWLATITDVTPDAECDGAAADEVWGRGE